MTSTIGIPIKLLNEATDITLTMRTGRVMHLERAYIRGSHVRYFIVPDMLRSLLSLCVPKVNNY
ncbi:small nuclear ribonucleoprotein Sm D3 [Elasticomyces elasticus]|nr:small nuclear ribonucleoprotein Sm D3 [Elasticomyces elasticus]